MMEGAEAHQSWTPLCVASTQSLDHHDFQLDSHDLGLHDGIDLNHQKSNAQSYDYFKSAEW